MQQPVLELGGLHLDMLGKLEPALEGAAGDALVQDLVGLAFGLGLLWAAWDPMRQTFHDKMAGTLVVRSSVYPPPNRPAVAGYQQPASPPNPYER